MEFCDSLGLGDDEQFISALKEAFSVVDNTEDNLQEINEEKENGGSRISWFVNWLRKFFGKSADDKTCVEVAQKIEKVLEKDVERLEEEVCNLADKIEK